MTIEGALKVLFGQLMKNWENRKWFLKIVHG